MLLLPFFYITFTECTLSPFVSGSSSEKIPFVFLPLRGQIIHPSREINFPGKIIVYKKIANDLWKVRVFV